MVLPNPSAYMDLYNFMPTNISMGNPNSDSDTTNMVPSGFHSFWNLKCYHLKIKTNHFQVHPHLNLYAYRYSKRTHQWHTLSSLEEVYSPLMVGIFKGLGGGRRKGGQTTVTKAAILVVHVIGSLSYHSSFIMQLQSVYTHSN